MDIANVLFYGGIAVVVLFLIILFCVSYIKAAPDEVIIISGFRKRRTIIGHAGFKIPFLERADKLSLQLFSIDVKTKAIPTCDYINVDVDAVVTVKVSYRRTKEVFQDMRQQRREARHYSRMVERPVFRGDPFPY